MNTKITTSMIPTTVDVEHVTDNPDTRNSVSSTDGWFLCNVNYHHGLISALEYAKEALEAAEKRLLELQTCGSPVKNVEAISAVQDALVKVRKEVP